MNKIDEKKLEKLMQKHFMTFEKLSKKANISKNTITNIKKGKTVPSVRTLENLCIALDCSPSDLLEE